MKKFRYLLWASLLVLVFASGGLSGVVLDRLVLQRVAPPSFIPANASPDFQLISQAWNDINKYYVDQAAADPQTLTYGAISGMVDALGDTGHSRFMTPEMVKEERNFVGGTLEGIGAEVRMKNNQVVIVAPMDGSPAQKSGLKPGDVILKVDGQDTTDRTLDQVVQQILGPPNTTVRLTLLRPASGRTMEITITRARITLHSVSWTRMPGTSVAHLRIAGFSRGVTEDLKKALTEIRQEGLTGFILDLRNSPGGLFDEAVGVTSQFVGSGNAVLEKDGSGKVTAVPVEPGGLALTMPMAVLINAGTASAAEIVTGALRDAHRGPLVGEKTFGAGTVLRTYGLSDGSALLLAFKEWLTPDGHLIWHQGISPDIEVPLSTETTPLLPESERGMTREELQASGDDQLLRALELIASPRNPVGMRP